MGEVYLADDTQLGRQVALKFLPVETSSDPDARARLIREARAAATLDHPYICAVYEVGEVDGLLFIAMQYVDGETLETRLRRNPFGVGETLSMAVQVVDAEAHRHGILHRDIKPANIMVTRRGEPKMMDFGLAKPTELDAPDGQTRTVSVLSTPGAMTGTLPYMSPEQVRGETLDPRSDLFSVGIVLYELITGRRPFDDSNPADRPARAQGGLRLQATPGTIVRCRAEPVGLDPVEPPSGSHDIPTPAPLSPAPATGAARRRSGGVLIGVVAILVAAAAGGWVLRKASRVRWAEAQVPQIVSLAENRRVARGQYVLSLEKTASPRPN